MVDEESLQSLLYDQMDIKSRNFIECLLINTPINSSWLQIQVGVIYGR